MEEDERGRKIPSVGSACDEIVEVIERLGKLRHPRMEMERTLDEIMQNHRLAFKVDHPLFQEYVGTWCTNEKRDSKFWKDGLLRVQNDFEGVFRRLYQGAKKSIFCTSKPEFNYVWKEDWAKRLLQAHGDQKRNRNIECVRVFVYPQRYAVTDGDKRVMENHREAGIDVRVYIDAGRQGHPYEYEIPMSGEWHMIDDGEAIGITRSIESAGMEVDWFFADREKIPHYTRVKTDLMERSIPLDNWLSQLRIAA
jgi:hypothetical protein